MSERSQQTQLLAEPKYYAFVDCSGIDPSIGAVSCGTVGLTEAEYDRQMDRPDSTWRCPRCRAPADYNDTLSEEAQGVNDEPPEPDGEAYRGGEAASALAEEQAEIQRTLK